MLSFKKFLLENHTPKTRWLAFDIPTGESEHRSHSKVIEQLKNRELHGVKGISANKRIVRQFLHTSRNALLVMPSHKVHELNPSVRPIDYHNPHSMMKNGMKDIHRILAKDPESSYETEQVMGHLFSYGVNHIKKENPNAVEYSMHHEAFNRGQDVHKAMLRANGGKMPEIHSPEDFAKHVHRALDHDKQIEQDHSAGKTEEKPIIGGLFKHRYVDDIRKTFENVGGAEKFAHHAVKGLAHVYRDEGEHAVEASSFKIPKESKLIVLTMHGARHHYANQPMGMSESDKKRVSELDTFHNSIKDLHNHYNVKEIEDMHYAKNRVYSKRPKFKNQK